MLNAHSSISSAFDLLRAGAERHYINRGLFSTYYLRERLFKTIGERGRKPENEALGIFERFGGSLPTEPGSVTKLLEAMGYIPVPVGGEGHPQYALRHGGVTLNVGCIVASVDSLDIKPGEMVVPSYQPVSLLKEKQWVILTNGRLWRLYSSKIASSSTNYFEVDI